MKKIVGIKNKVLSSLYEIASTCLGQGIFRNAQVNKDEEEANLLMDRNISIRPNPANENATISYLVYGEINCRMQITDHTGKLIKQYELPCKQNFFSFSTENLSPGFYLVKVFDNGILVGKSKFGIVK